MAAACLRSGVLLRKLTVIDFTTNSQPVYCGCIGVLSQVTSVRNGSFFNKKSAESVWDSVTSVSNQGRKRGRASRGKLMRRQNFNFGQFIGKGESGMHFPGLSGPIMKEGKVTRMQSTAQKNLTFHEDLQAWRSSGKKAQKEGMPALQRGYSGRYLMGRRIGPPDPIQGYHFDGFDTIVLQNKLVGNVTASQGKVYSTSVLVVTGNKNGLAGWAMGKAQDSRAAIRNAKNKAAQRMVYFDRFEDHTLWHNFHEKYHNTAITAFKRHKGHGIVSHRVLKSICELIGIKNVYIKAEGRTKNTLSLTRAFFNGLENQKTHQELSDELGHHIVEYRREKDFYPEVKASPAENTNTEFKKKDDFDFETYFFGGKQPLMKKSMPFYHKFPRHRRRLFLDYKFRNQMDMKMERVKLGLEPPSKAT